MANSNSQSSGAAPRWPNFYEMLHVAPDVSPEVLRSRIRESYMEATANTDHRNLARRIHYQTMVERIVPQARHILLDPEIRADYDRQLNLHQNRDPNALDYIDFLREVPGSRAFGANPTSTVWNSSGAQESPKAAAPKNAQRDVESAAREANVFSEAAPDAPTFWSDMALRDEFDDDEPASEKNTSIRPSFGGHPEFDRTHSAPKTSAKAPSAPNAAAFDDLPIQNAARENAARENAARSAAPRADAPQNAAPQTFAEQPETTATNANATNANATNANSAAAPVSSPRKPIGEPIPIVLPPDAVPPTEDGVLRAKTVSAAEVAALADSHSTVLTPEAMRVERVRGAASPRTRHESERRVLSHTVQMLLAAIVAAGLTLFILRSTQVPAKIPLRIVYAPGLEKVMQAERAQFARTPAGASIDLIMQPLDGRAAMQAALAPNFAADMWIPAEALWSEQFNAVAASKGAKQLTQTRSLALSPSVLIARADRSAALLRRFPNRIISSWDALRKAIIADGAGHFGLADPVRSGSGSVARYFMAREWSERNRRELTSQTAGDAALWRWMSGFEDNVPVSERVSSDMVKDLAQGTGNRYWWAIALESEAIGQIQAGKKLEIFYLPQTNYAQHPLCAWDRGGENSAQMSGARAAFDALLRTPDAQQNLLRNGYRPTDLELSASVKGNPFTDANLRAHGLRREGFRVVERIPYRTLNALNNAWKERYS